MTQWGIDTLFNPAKRHMDEEKQRLQSTREEVGDASGGKRIDFEKGKVVIRREAGDESDSADGDNDTAPAEGGNGSAKAGKSAAKPMSAAAIRAAKRRGREPR